MGEDQVIAESDQLLEIKCNSPVCLESVNDKIKQEFYEISGI